MNDSLILDRRHFINEQTYFVLISRKLSHPYPDNHKLIITEIRCVHTTLVAACGECEAVCRALYEYLTDYLMLKVYKRRRILELSIKDQIHHHAMRSMDHVLGQIGASDQRLFVYASPWTPTLLNSIRSAPQQRRP